MSSRVTASAAARDLSKLLDRIGSRGEEFVIERGGKPVGRLSPVRRPATTVADLVRLLKTAPRPDKGYIRELRALRDRQQKLPRSPWAK